MQGEPTVVVVQERLAHLLRLCRRVVGLNEKEWAERGDIAELGCATLCGAVQSDYALYIEIHAHIPTCSDNMTFPRYARS